MDSTIVIISLVAIILMSICYYFVHIYFINPVMVVLYDGKDYTGKKREIRRSGPDGLGKDGSYNIGIIHPGFKTKSIYLDPSLEATIVSVDNRYLLTKSTPDLGSLVTLKDGKDYCDSSMSANIRMKQSAPSAQS